MAERSLLSVYWIDKSASSDFQKTKSHQPTSLHRCFLAIEEFRYHLSRSTFLMLTSAFGIISYMMRDVELGILENCNHIKI